MLDNAMWIFMDNHFGFRKALANGHFNFITDFMGVNQWQVVVHFQVNLDKDDGPERRVRKSCAPKIFL